MVERGGGNPVWGGLSCGEDPTQQVSLTALTSLRQEKDRNHENRVGEAPPRMAAPALPLSLPKHAGVGGLP